MIIGIVGNTDKRLIIYSLMKLLAHKGDVCVITPTNQLKRLIGEQGSDLGYLENNLIAVSPLSMDEVWEAINYTPQDFDFVIVDLENDIANDVDMYIHVRGHELDDSDREFISEIDGLDLDIHYMKLSYDGKRDKDKSVHSVRVTMKDIIGIEKTENLKELSPIRNPTLAKVLSKILSEKIKLNGKAIASVLKGGRS